MHKLYYLLLLLLVGCATVSYEDRVSKWDSYMDVARWMRTNFRYEKTYRMRNAEKVYKYGSGNCQDGTNFVVQTLNRINPQYNARSVFINNPSGNNHWAAAFDYNGKLYIMDYSTGRGWARMQGTHGPYNSLSEYHKFLDSLPIPNFNVKSVTFGKGALQTVADGKDFVKNENGVIYDKRTGLEWVVGPDQDMTWDEANYWAKNFKIPEKSWRLPSISELRWLYTIDKDGNKKNILMNGYRWVWSEDIGSGLAACVMFFGNGGWIPNGKKMSDSRRAFAVRAKE